MVKIHFLNFSLRTQENCYLFLTASSHLIIYPKWRHSVAILILKKIAFTSSLWIELVTCVILSYQNSWLKLNFSWTEREFQLVSSLLISDVSFLKQLNGIKISCLQFFLWQVSEDLLSFLTLSSYLIISSEWRHSSAILIS